MKKQKNNKFKNTVELQLGSEEILEFLDFLKVAESGGLRCSSATKIKSQLHEFVISRIEGRNPNAYVVSTDDLVALMDQKNLQKLAFDPDGTSTNTALFKKYNAASPQEIVQPNPSIHNIPNDSTSPIVHEIGSFRAPSKDDWQTDSEGKMHLKSSTQANGQ